MVLANFNILKQVCTAYDFRINILLFRKGLAQLEITQFNALIHLRRVVFRKRYIPYVLFKVWMLLHKNTSKWSLKK